MLSAEAEKKVWTRVKLKLLDLEVADDFGFFGLRFKIVWENCKTLSKIVLYYAQWLFSGYNHENSVMLAQFWRRGANFVPRAAGDCLKSEAKVWSCATVYRGCKGGYAIMTREHGAL